MPTVPCEEGGAALQSSVESLQNFLPLADANGWIRFLPREASNASWGGKMDILGTIRK